MKEAVAPPWSHSMNNKVKALITNLKHLPGVYLMHNAKDEIIYIGKAKDLYNRVSQYFLRPQAGKVAKMVFDVDYFETIITKTEKEALILEMNLIQTHYPKYNILLKDDSHYPYIALHKKGDPFLTIKRNNKDRNYDYFGPFPSGKSARGTIELLNKIFPLRKCSPLKKEPCLYYHLGQCLAPCIKPVDSSVYETIVEQIKRFFKGDSATIKREYEKKMLDASSEQKYELAAEYKKIVDYIEHISAAQNVESNDHKDYDVFAYATRDNYLALSVIVYRDGMVLGKNSFVVERFDELGEQVQDLILQYYQKHTTPVEIVINDENVIALLSDYLDSRIESVTRGHRFELVSMAIENAQNALDEYSHHGDYSGDKQHLGWQYDGAYKPLVLSRVVNSWVRDVNFTSVSEALSINESANSSAYNITIDGTRGHSAVRAQHSTRVFIGKVNDISTGKDADGNLCNGQFHGCGVSKPSIGCVIWNSTWGSDACFESHATQPRATLFDNCSGGLVYYRAGGAEKENPNHLAGLTIWNLDVTGTDKHASAFSWWSNTDIWWKIYPPIVVGTHGENVTFADPTVQMTYEESTGAKVTPNSLYEAQLEKRLGYVPGWLKALK